MHHRQKKDHPSGTAKEIARRLLQEIPRKKRVSTSLPDGPIDSEALQIVSIRTGYHAGMHEVSFDSPDGTIKYQT